MNLYRYLPYILIFTLVSCLKEKPALADNKDLDIKDTVLRIAPLDLKLRKLSRSYKNSKEDDIEDFYRKLWKRDDLSGGFLVAKNGQILFEEYGGYANRSEKDEITKHTPI